MVKKSEAPAKAKKSPRVRVAAGEEPKVRVSEEAGVLPEEATQGELFKTRAS